VDGAYSPPFHQNLGGESKYLKDIDDWISWDLQLPAILIQGKGWFTTLYSTWKVLTLESNPPGAITLPAVDYREGVFPQLFNSNPSTASSRLRG
jgi:hypothetical protein